MIPVELNGICLFASLLCYNQNYLKMQCYWLFLFSKQVFSTKMKEAVQEIRNTVTVNTSDISAKSSDDKDVQKDGDKLTRKKGGKPCGIFIL